MKVVVVGLDGGNWDLIAPWLVDGSLPNIQHLRERGVWAEMESQLPPVTFPNWKCYSTGKNPGKLGVYWWERIDFENRQLTVPDARSFKSEEIFDLLGQAECRVGVVNMPSLYPPKPVNGFLIAGGPGTPDTGYTFPANLQTELERELGYRVRPVLPIADEGDIERGLDDILHLIDLRFEVVQRYWDQVDFIHVTVFYTNVLQHFLYRGEAVKRAWQRIDAHIGRLMERDCTIFLMSDHGCDEIDTEFYINTWLEREGYLKTVGGMTNRLFRLGLTRERLRRLARPLGVLELLKRIAPKRLQQVVPAADGVVRKQAKADQIDWERSRVVASSQGPIYLGAPAGSSEYEALCDELIDKLTRLTSPLSGRQVVKRVYRREEVYTGPYLRLAPDLVFEQAEGIHANGGIGRAHVFARPDKWRAENVRTGIFLAYGPDIDPQAAAQGVRIIDLAPTLLHLLGQPVPNDMDGRVLAEIFRDNSEPAMRPVHRSTASDAAVPDSGLTENEEALVRDRLRDLGYLS